MSRATIIFRHPSKYPYPSNSPGCRRSRLYRVHRDVVDLEVLRGINREVIDNIGTDLAQGVGENYPLYMSTVVP